jgi:hypothetical protein
LPDQHYDVAAKFRQPERPMRKIDVLHECRVGCILFYYKCNRLWQVSPVRDFTEPTVYVYGLFCADESI